jgi:hypothetical protein
MTTSSKSTAQQLLAGHSQALYDDATKPAALKSLISQAEYSDHQSIVFSDGSVIEMNHMAGSVSASPSGKWSQTDIATAIEQHQAKQNAAPSLIARFLERLRGKDTVNDDTHVIRERQ